MRGTSTKTTNINITKLLAEESQESLRRSSTIVCGGVLRLFAEEFYDCLRGRSDTKTVSFEEADDDGVIVIIEILVITRSLNLKS